MRAIDLMEDGFPHGSREGYEQGCHSKGACMGPLNGLPTCTDAYARSRTDMGYRRRLDAGMSVLEIAAEDAALVESLRGKPKVKPAGEIGVEQSGEPIRGRDLVDVNDDELEDDLEDMVDEVEADEPDEQPVAVAPKPAPPKFEAFVPEGNKRGRVSAADLERMVELHGEGLSNEQIGAAVARSAEAVGANLERLGLAPNAAEVVDEESLTPEEPIEAIKERGVEVRAEGLLADLADARAEAERLQGDLDRALADVSIEQAARSTLETQVEELTAQRITADAGRLTAEKEVGALKDRVASLLLELDVAKSPAAVREPSGVDLATVPSAPVATVQEQVAAGGPRLAGMGLDIQPSADGGVSVRLHGAEPLQLSLQFAEGALRDVGVKIGA